MKARLAGNEGFTTAAIMITMMLATLLAAAAFATANNDIPLARGDQNEKQAYSAAEAGVAFYAYHLSQDPNYWTYCADPPNPPTPNPLWDGVDPGERTWRSMPSPTASTDQGAPPSYSITLVPAPGAVKCEDGLASSTFLNQQTGTFTIRSTGLYRGHKRSIVATFKRRGFVDFLWFTNFETPDPLAYPVSDQQNIRNNCVKFRRDGRPTGNPCSDQQFPTFDHMLGPMHTNDRFYTCGTPEFGLTANDRIEASDPNEFETACGPATPSGAGTFIGGAPLLDFPPTNNNLASDTLTGWTWTGPTRLHFNSNGTVDITNQAISNSGHTQTFGLPPNNVIYVRNSTCTTQYQEAQKYPYVPPTAASGCGDAWVDGDYPKSLTIGADNDVIVDGNLKRSDPQAEMGLIANGFVRVYHPIQWQNGQSECTNTSDGNATGSITNLEIDAAILSLRHSFMVDNPACGTGLGALTVDGAIAQWFRGTVGTFNGGSPPTLRTGYSKNYNYDQNLRYADPPYFLDPVETSWNVVRETEQVPAQ